MERAYLCLHRQTLEHFLWLTQVSNQYILILPGYVRGGGGGGGWWEYISHQGSTVMCGYFNLGGNFFFGSHKSVCFHIDWLCWSVYYDVDWLYLSVSDVKKGQGWIN